MIQRLLHLIYIKECMQCYIKYSLIFIYFFLKILEVNIWLAEAIQ